MRPEGKGVYEECALGLEFMEVKPHPVAMIQSPSGVPTKLAVVNYTKDVFSLLLYALGIYNNNNIIIIMVSQHTYNEVQVLVMI